MTAGAPGLIASSASSTCGSTSQSTLTFATASSAMRSLSAMIGRDRLALVADLLVRDERLVVHAEIEQAQKRIEIARHVLAEHDAHHARHALRFARIDAADAGVMMRAAHAFDMQQSVEQMIVEIGRAAGHMAERVLTLRRLADLVEIVVALVGEQVLAEFDHGFILIRNGVRRRCVRQREWRR